MNSSCAFLNRIGLFQSQDIEVHSNEWHRQGRKMNGKNGNCTSDLMGFCGKPG